MIDLAKPFETAANVNQNQAACALMRNPNWDPSILDGLVVIHKGRIVAEAYNKLHFRDKPLFQASCTKSWHGLILGMLLDAKKLRLDSTLGEIFAQPDDEEDENTSGRGGGLPGGPNLWAQVANATAKQQITIEQLLTNTHGLF